MAHMTPHDVAPARTTLPIATLPGLGTGAALPARGLAFRLLKFHVDSSSCFQSSFLLHRSPSVARWAAAGVT